MDKIKCAGCGIEIQTENPAKPGYAPASSLSKESIVCKRCFRMKHYNEVSNVTLKDEDFLRLLNSIGKTDSLIVKMVDLFDFDGSWLSGIQRFIGQNSMLVVVNKIDLLPKTLHPTKIEHWVRRRLKSFGISPVEVLLCSAKKNIGFEEVVGAIDHYRQGKDVYVVGSANVGKSTLINRLIHDFSDLDMELTTSRYPGTTLDLVHIPLEDGKAIIDTPGIIHRNRLTELVTPHDLQLIMPDKTINARGYQLNDQQTLFFGAMARIDFVKGTRQSFICYLSNEMPIHRTKLENADSLYANHRGEMLAPPFIEAIDSLPPFTKHTLRIKSGDDQDVFIAGLGWIALQGEDAVVEVHAPKGVSVGLRPSLI